MYKITISSSGGGEVVNIDRSTYPHRNYGFLQLLGSVRKSLKAGDKTVVITGHYYDEDMFLIYEHLGLSNNCNLDISINNVSVYSHYIEATDDTNDTEKHIVGTNVLSGWKLI